MNTLYCNVLTIQMGPNVRHILEKNYLWRELKFTCVNDMLIT